MSDPAEAREIEQVYGTRGTKQVNVVEDERAAWHINSDRSTDGHNATHHYTFQGVDTSHFKVWVLKRGKAVRVTKAQAHAKGYKIIAETKKRPDLAEVQNGI